MKKQLLLFTIGFLLAASLPAQTVLFDQADTVVGDWSEGVTSGSGVWTGANPRTLQGTVGSAERIWTSTNAGLGILNDATNIVEWSFDFSWNGSTFASVDSFSILIAATTGIFDGGGTDPADGYLFGTAAGGGTLKFGHGDSGGKPGVQTTLYDTGVSANANASGNVTITFNPTTTAWTVGGSFNNTAFTTTGNTFNNTTYTGVNTSFLGSYIRNQAGSTTPALTLGNMQVAVIPEPSSFALLAGALVAAGIVLRRRGR